MRVHRHLRDRLMSLLLRIHRYRCRDLACGWEGVVSIPRPPEPRTSWTERFAWLSAGWPARLAWMAIGIVCAVVPIEGGRYLIERQRARAVGETAAPGPELLAPLPGDHFDGSVVAAAAVVPSEATPSLERRNGCVWGQPGRNPYKGNVRQVLAGANLPPEVVGRIEKMVERQRVTDRVQISNSGIWSTGSQRRFDTNVVAMGFGKSLCFNTRVNFPYGHVEAGDLYETTDDAGGKYAVMVPYVCGNVAVLAERAERREPVRSAPEPATWASLLAGLAAMAWAMRRRRSGPAGGGPHREPACREAAMTIAVLLFLAALAASTSDALAAPPGSPPAAWDAPSATTTAAEIAALRAAANRNEVAAQYDLGLALACGYGTRRNRVEAATWFRKAAEQGHVRAQSVLGWMYMTGTGVPRSDGQAVRWLRSAAEYGDTTAQNNLGIAYAQGRGVRLDEVEAEKWFSRAAAQGAEDAARNLDVLRKGKAHAVRPSPGKALESS